MLTHPQTIHFTLQVPGGLTHRLTNFHRFPVCSHRDTLTVTDSQSPVRSPTDHKLSHIHNVLTHRPKTLTRSQCDHHQTHKLSHIPNVLTHRFKNIHTFPLCSHTDSQITTVFTHRLTNSHTFPLCSPADSQTLTHSHCTHPQVHKLSHIPRVLTHRLTNSYTFPLWSPTALHPPVSLVVTNVTREENRTCCGSMRTWNCRTSQSPEMRE